MGRRDRERIARILAGDEAPISAGIRARVKEKMVDVGVAAVKSYSTSRQIQFLADALHTGRLPARKLQEVLKDNAPKEMRKGTEKLVKKHKTPTVELLLEEYYKDEGFQALALEVGLNEQWFIELAESECQKWEDDK